MCLPLAPAALAGISTAVGAASSIVGYIGQSQQANAQQAYQNQVYQQQQQQALAQAEYQNRQVQQQNQYVLDNAANARAALATDRAALVSRERQEGLATALDIEQKRIERLKAVGALQSSERAGGSLDSLMADYYRQEAGYKSIAQQNLSFTAAQIQREQTGLTATAQGRINSVRPYESAPIQQPTAPAPVSRPSLFGAALNIGSNAVSNYSRYSSYDPYSNRYRIGSGSLNTSTGPKTAASAISNIGHSPSQQIIPVNY